MKIETKRIIPAYMFLAIGVCLLFAGMALPPLLAAAGVMLCIGALLLSLPFVRNLLSHSESGNEKPAANIQVQVKIERSTRLHWDIKKDTVDLNVIDINRKADSDDELEGDPMLKSTGDISEGQNPGQKLGPRLPKKITPS